VAETRVHCTVRNQRPVTSHWQIILHMAP